MRIGCSPSFAASVRRSPSALSGRNSSKRGYLSRSSRLGLSAVVYRIIYNPPEITFNIKTDESSRQSIAWSYEAMKSAFSRKKSGYIPTLDGWRAVAILGVILFHGGPLFPHGTRVEALRLLGEDGVRLFFAISGILICTRLMDEEETRGSVSFRNFYVRRLFRIQPAAIVFLLALVLLAAIGTIPFYARGWWTALLASRSFVAESSTANGAWYTTPFPGHWRSRNSSISLVLPLLLLFTSWVNTASDGLRRSP